MLDVIANNNTLLQNSKAVGQFVTEMFLMDICSNAWYLGESV